MAVAAAEAALVVSVGALAQPGSPTLIAPQALTTPTLDGALKPADEWADAASLPVTFAGHPATLSVKHDNTYLYVLLAVQDSPPPAGSQCCSATISFDNDRSGTAKVGDDAMGFGPANQSSDQFLTTGLKQYSDDQRFNGTQDTASAGSYDPASGRLILEARKPLCSADSAHDFCVKAGSALGFTLHYVSSAGSSFDYPAAAADFAHFADLRISSATAADVDVKVAAQGEAPHAGDKAPIFFLVNNDGPGEATNVVLDVTYKTSSGLRVVLPSGVCGCKVGDIAPGDGRMIAKTVTVTSVPAQGGTISASATVTFDNGDPDPTNNADSLDTPVIGTPSAGDSVNASTSAGVVSVRSAGTSKFVPLGPGQSVPVGSEVDASKGQVQIASQTPSGAIQTATASAGRFQVTQAKDSALTTLRLTAPIPKCTAGRGTTVLRRLSIKAKGQFRTVGARGYAVGKTSNASWVLVDRCVPDRSSRSLASGAKPRKPPKRHLQTCVEPGVSNPSRHTQADAYDPSGHKVKGNCIPAP